MSTRALDTYKTVTATTADPITLTTMLYDGGVKAMKKARIHFESGNREGFVKETERAYLIVGELLATLDMEQGELPKNAERGLCVLHALHRRVDVGGHGETQRG